MRCDWLCSRPAVSMMTTSARRERAACTASNTTAPGSAPACCWMMSAPLRVAQTPSCSMAAARKVSPAASTTCLRASAKRRASLPMVVVLPEPFTPTTSSTKGLCREMSSGFCDGQQDGGDGIRQRRDERVDVVELLARDLLAQLVEDVLRGLDADVGGEQARLELVENLGVDLAARAPGWRGRRRATSPAG